MAQAATKMLRRVFDAARWSRIGEDVRRRRGQRNNGQLGARGRETVVNEDG